MLAFPLATFVRFCHNHGLIQVSDRPQWHTVVGGSRVYVQKMLASLGDTRLRTPVRTVRRVAGGVIVATDNGSESFDDVVLACHSDQALRLLGEPSAKERELLGAIRYQPNRAVLHTDTSVLPQRRKAWAAWNYERGADSAEETRVCLHYLLNQLQPLPWTQPVVVSLNPVRAIDPSHVMGEYDYAHPVFDLAAIRAQTRMHQVQGQRGTWFAGAWMGYGFHEDGLKSGLNVGRALQQLIHDQSQPVQEKWAA
jgi:predicted NAD/FAD-binding protein